MINRARSGRAALPSRAARRAGLAAGATRGRSASCCTTDARSTTRAGAAVGRASGYAGAAKGRAACPDCAALGASARTRSAAGGRASGGDDPARGRAAAAADGAAGSRTAARDAGSARSGSAAVAAAAAICAAAASARRGRASARRTCGQREGAEQRTNETSATNGRDHRPLFDMACLLPRTARRNKVWGGKSSRGPVCLFRSSLSFGAPAATIPAERWI